MKTKERILLKALELFNEFGVKEVTLRQVALALEISQGNLNYHFKLKNDIITALYYRLVEEMDAEIGKLVKEQPVLSQLYQSSYVTMKKLYEYKFLLKDLYSVLSSNEELKTHYMGLQQKREEQYLLVFQYMTEQGILRNEELEDEFVRLYARMNILGDNWINASLLFRDKNKSVVDYYHQLLFEVIYPYLTEKGKGLYRDLI